MRIHLGLIGRFKFNLVEAAAGVACVLTGGLIILNAVSLQPGPHPAPMFSNTQSDANVSTEEQSNEEAENPDLLKDVQLALVTAGYLNDSDSEPTGPDVSQIIREFQSANDLPVTGKASEMLLARILLTGSGKESDPISEIVAESGTSPVTFSIPADVGSTVKLVQKGLDDLGYGPLTADGIMGSLTIEAIQKFEKDRGLPLTGRLTSELIEELKYGG